MKKIWSGEDLIIALGDLLDNSKITSFLKEGYYGEIQFNSQDIKDNDIFICLKGSDDKLNGHQYIFDALENGCKLVIADYKFILQFNQNKIKDEIKLLLEKYDNNIIYVNDSLLALERLAKWKRSKSKAKFIAITGSVGKTTTKQVIYNILSTYGRSFCSRGNFNNYLGLLLNLASMPDDIKYAVIELGISNNGELDILSKLTRPDIAIITHIGASHLEFLKNLENVAKAKSEIFYFMNNGGKAILNSDMPYYSTCHKIALENNITEKNIFNISNDDVSNGLKILDSKSDLKSKFHYILNGNHIIFDRSYIADHFKIIFAIAILVVDILKIDKSNFAQVIEVLKAFEPESGRGKIDAFNISYNNKKKHLNIICDFYNANPESMKSAISSFAHLSKNSFIDNNIHKSLILGDMGELGDDALNLHLELAEFINNSGVTKIFLIGDLMPLIKEKITIIDKKQIFIYKDVFELKEDLLEKLYKNELILIKGSRFMKLDLIYEYLQSFKLL